MQSGSTRSSGLSFLNAIMEAHKTSDINLIFSLRHGRQRAENTERNAKNAAYFEMALKLVDLQERPVGFFSDESIRRSIKDSTFCISSDKNLHLSLVNEASKISLLHL